MSGARAAFEQITGFGYNTEPFGELPCVCLRIPTGGGKTLLGAHAVVVATIQSFRIEDTA